MAEEAAYKVEGNSIDGSNWFWYINDCVFFSWIKTKVR
jgi:hypothetical protein